jgi:acetylornithine/N-succinyldiaminopimelate aminotransferase
MSDLRSGFLRHLAQTSESPIGLEIERASGSWLMTRDGRRYLDFIAGIGVSALGHGHPAVLAALAGQAARYLHVMVYGEYVLETQVALASRLAALLPPPIDRVYFTNSGAEAIEGALKTARKYTGRAAWAAFDGAYHGDTLAALALAGNPAFRAPFQPLPGPVIHLPYNDEQALAKLDASVSAVVIEPIQAEAGVRIPSECFMYALRRRCDELGALLIYDEVLTGFGRTGKLFALEHFGITPDIVVLAKALGGGLPLGAFCAPSEILAILSRDPPLGHITTFGGHPLSCATGLAALEFIITNRLWERAHQASETLLAQLRELVDQRCLCEVRGLGLLLGLEFTSAELARRFVEKTIADGVVVNWTLNADNVVRLAPPLTISDEDINLALSVMRKALTDLHSD